MRYIPSINFSSEIEIAARSSRYVQLPRLHKLDERITLDDDDDVRARSSFVRALLSRSDVARQLPRVITEIIFACRWHRNRKPVALSPECRIHLRPVTRMNLSAYSIPYNAPVNTATGVILGQYTGKYTDCPPADLFVSADRSRSIRLKNLLPFCKLPE